MLVDAMVVLAAQASQRSLLRLYIELNEGGNSVKMVTIFLALALLGAGCSGSDSTEDLNIAEEFTESLDSFQATRLEVEEAIAVCMLSFGYEYEAPIQLLKDLSAQDNDLTSETTAFLANRDSWSSSGYGFIDVLLRGRMASAFPSYVAAQGDGFLQALYGTPDDDDGGCSGRAYAEESNLEEMQDLNEDLLRAEERASSALSSRPELTEWTRCMAQAGFAVNSLSGPAEWLQTEVDELMESAAALTDDDLFAGLTFDPDTGEYSVPSAYGQAFIDSLYDLEIGLATADYTCSKDLYPLAQELYLAELTGAG